MNHADEMAKAPFREFVPRDPARSMRWHQHDYPHALARWNYHPEYELHLIRAGTGRYFVGDAIGSFGPGHVALIGPNLPHHWVSPPGEVTPGRDVVLQFHPEWIAACQRVIPELDDLNPLLANANRGVQFVGSTAARIAELLERIGTAEGPGRAVTVVEVLAALATSPEEHRRYLTSPWFPTVCDTAAAGLVEKAFAYIHRNLDGEVTLAEAARRCGMSASTFSRQFASASGQSFSELVRLTRIARACRLLITTDDQVARIAHAVGYRNLSNFNRQFLMEQGVTPRDFRALHLGG